MDESRNILTWTEVDVHLWFSKLGYPQYESNIREHNISGEVLCLLDAEGLKDMGIATIGQRLAILKAVYNLKVAHNIPIEHGHYVPPSEAEERQENLSVERLYDLLKDQSERLRSLEEDNRRLTDSFHSCLDDINGLRLSSRANSGEAESPVQRQTSFKWASFVKPSRSPTKTGHEVESPQPSPQRMEHDMNSHSSRSQPPPQSRSQPSSYATDSSSTSNGQSSSSTNGAQQQPPKAVRQDSSDNLKSFKVSLDDPAWKVLPAALKKYKINNDDWQNYAMFICYGSTGNRIERCLSYDEKPLLLFQKLKDAKKNPVFMLKHIKDIRSPIAVAQQKQAARKASEASSSKLTTPALQGQGQGHSSQSQDARIRPPTLEVNGHLGNVASTIMTGVAGAQGGWPEVTSPAVEKERTSDELGPDGTKLQNAVITSGSSSGSGSAEMAETNTPAILREIPPSTGVSYAVAIYPYMAEQEDEFDVVVGDTFIILSRARGWWVVQRDPAGSGLVEPDTSKQGWVPAGCLLETNVPVATAIAEATARGLPNGTSSTPSSPAEKTPILPLSILSTSFPGIALWEYKKKGEEELDLVNGDFLRVFKRYNHWSYAVKEETGDRGWVPSWYIGKVPTGPPGTPSTSFPPPHNLTASLPDTDARFANDSISTQGPQVSPMSSAFPPMQTRTTAVI